ncbi:MAG TPA: substrate-binding domain-containing protein [Stellaceae bacterium]|nr:substrate-binding domain-containing protein [Stellaceae bacterium]
MIKRISVFLVIAAVALAGVPLPGASASAAEIHVISSGGFTPAFRELAPEYEKQSGNKTALELGASMGATPTSIPSRLERGEPADVLLMVGYALDQLIKTGRALPGSRVDLSRSSIGMAVRAGAPKPDISTVEAFKRTLLSAKSIAYSDSASGVYLSTDLFKRLGIADQVKDKSRMIPGDPVGGVVAKGEAEIGFQQISELKPIPGIDIVGPIPAEVQQVTIYAAGIAANSKDPAAAKTLIDFLASPGAATAIRVTGMETMRP